LFEQSRAQSKRFRTDTEIEDILGVVAGVEKLFKIEERV
jgi:hypothetical protein